MHDKETSNVLSPRELEMISYVARGLNFREIGEETGISPRTVQKHIINLLKKMGARNKTHMVAMALAQNLVSPPPVERIVLPPVPTGLKIAA